MQPIENQFKTHIREVLPHELNTLRAFSESTFRQAFAHQNDPVHFEKYMEKSRSIDQIKKEYTAPGSIFYFMEMNGELVAYFKLNTGKDQTERLDDRALEIQQIYVAEPFQGRGLGKILLDFCVKKALQKGAPFIWLGVWEMNTEAKQFYERHGFSAFDTHEFDLGGDIQTDVLMKRVLK
ncbi:MAG: GNAT family N-acetyltransferase [Cyclobacteriaceae bacterium]|nr:GNAT family N-acetyltransferase [Cyclobacteriaceae bacterium]